MLIGLGVAGGLAMIGLAATWVLAQPAEQTWAERPLAHLVRANLGRALALRAELNLSEQQRIELKGIFMAHREEFRPLAADIVAHKRALRHAVMAEDPNEATIRAESAALGEAIGDVSVALAGVAAEARTVLTPEQIELIEQSAAEREAAVDRWLAQLGE